jgi:hypothetical protein
MNETRLGIAAYLAQHRAQLDLIERMWNDPLVRCYNDAEMPSADELAFGSVFLAGPTSRHQILEYNCRCQAVAYLREAGFCGIIYIPEPRGLEEKADFTDRAYIHWWESDRLLSCSHPVIWAPRNSDELLGLNTNFEWGWVAREILARGNNAKIFIGWPDEAERMGLPRHYSYERAGLKRYDTLRRLCFAVMDKVPPEEIANPTDNTPL